MPGRRLPIDFNSTTGVLDENGEIRIGAFARRQVRRRLLFGAFGVCLIGLAGGLYWGLGADRFGSAEQPIVALRCGECDAGETRALPPDQNYPVRCPKCGAQAVRPLWVCRKCDEQFLPPLQSDPIRCPRCSSDQVGAVPAAAKRPPG